MYLHQELTHQIIPAAIEVHKTLGPGLLDRPILNAGKSPHAASVETVGYTQSWSPETPRHRVLFLRGSERTTTSHNNYRSAN